jgi:hypothetical protein
LISKIRGERYLFVFLILKQLLYVAIKILIHIIYRCTPCFFGEVLVVHLLSFLWWCLLCPSFSTIISIESWLSVLLMEKKHRQTGNYLPMLYHIPCHTRDYRGTSDTGVWLMFCFIQHISTAMHDDAHNPFWLLVVFLFVFVLCLMPNVCLCVLFLLFYSTNNGYLKMSCFPLVWTKYFKLIFVYKMLPVRYW